MGIIRGFIEECGDTWTMAQTHPFAEAMGMGDLSRDAFRFYLIQDYIYLIAYCRVIALAIYRAPNLEIMKEMAGLLNSTLETEMSLHRKYAASFGIPEAELENAVPAPAMLAYTSYMLDIAAREDFLANIVCLLPCAIGYTEIGARLKSEQQAGGSNPYQEWIDTYSSAEFRDYAKWLENLADQLAEGLSESRRAYLFNIFLTSTKHEWLFWEMGMKQKDWPV